MCCATPDRRGMQTLTFNTIALPTFWAYLVQDANADLWAWGDLPSRYGLQMTYITQNISCHIWCACWNSHSFPTHIGPGCRNYPFLCPHMPIYGIICTWTLAHFSSTLMSINVIAFKCYWNCYCCSALYQAFPHTLIEGLLPFFTISWKLLWIKRCPAEITEIYLSSELRLDFEN